MTIMFLRVKIYKALEWFAFLIFFIIAIVTTVFLYSNVSSFFVVILPISITLYFAVIGPKVNLIIDKEIEIFKTLYNNIENIESTYESIRLNHIERQIEKELFKMLDSKKRGIYVVIGEGGLGKSELLIYLAKKCLGNYNVLFCDNIRSTEQFENLIKDNGKLINRLIRRISLKRRRNKYLEKLINVIAGKKNTVIFIDSIEPILYEKSKKQDFINLIKDISKLIKSGRNISALIAIRKYDFEKHLDRNLSDEIRRSIERITIKPFDDDEIQKFIDKQKIKIRLDREYYIFRIPFFLKIAANLSRQINAPTAIDILEEYWCEKVEEEVDNIEMAENIVYTLSRHLYQNRSISIKRRSDDELVNLLKENNPILEKLVSIGLVKKYNSEVFGFAHQIFLEYFYARYVVDACSFESAKQILKNIISNIEDNPFSRNVIEYCIGLYCKDRYKNVEMFQWLINTLASSTFQSKKVLLNAVCRGYLCPEASTSVLEQLKNVILCDFALLEIFLENIISEKCRFYHSLWLREEIAGLIDEITAKLNEIDIETAYEIKRKIAEALPTLYKINKEVTVRIIKKLRYDYSEKGKTDIRRRVIEALEYIETNEDFKELLDVSIDKKGHRDEIFTIFAILEILFYRYMDLNKCRSIINKLSSFKFTQDEIEGAENLLHFLSLIKGCEDSGLINDEVLSFIERRLDINNKYIKIAITRNLKRLLNINDEDGRIRILKIITSILDREKDWQVRGPIVRKSCIRVLLNLMRDEKYSKDCRDILLKLAKDEYYLIPATLLDLIPEIDSTDHKLAKEIVKTILGKFSNGEVKNLKEKIKKKYWDILKHD